MGIGLVLAGLILLFNPVIIVVDVIPDAVGFFLIAAGLTKMSCFIGKIEEARQTFLKLAFVEVAKLFSIVILPYASGSADVLLAFVFGLIEGFLFVPAVRNLFEGLSFAALWYGGTQSTRSARPRAAGRRRPSSWRRRRGGTSSSSISSALPRPSCPS